MTSRFSDRNLCAANPVDIRVERAGGTTAFMRSDRAGHQNETIYPHDPSIPAPNIRLYRWRGQHWVWADAVNLKVAEISDVVTPAELWRLVRGYYLSLGFRGLAYFMTSRGGSGTRGGFNLIHRGLSRAVSQAYIV